MRVLHLSGAMIWGGNEQQLVNFIHCSNDEKLTNYVYCFKNSPMEKYVIEHKIPYFSIEEGKPFSMKLAKFLSNIVKKNNIDIIHIHTSNFVTVFMISDVFFRLNKPTVFSKKGISDKSSALSAIKYNYSGIDKVICVSNAVLTAYKNVIKPKNHHKLTVIYDGIQINEDSPNDVVNLREKFNIKSDKKIIGNIANHSQAKDLSVFLKTANEVINIKGIKDIHFIQIGEKLKYTEEFIGLLEEYNLHDFVTFTGKIDNAKWLLPQFDIFMITSKKEGLPLTIYEAFLKNIPVISTKAGGIPEAIAHHENGLLAEIGDYHKLADNIVELIDNDKLKEKFVKKSYQRLIAEFDAKKSAEKTYQLYQSIS